MARTLHFSTSLVIVGCLVMNIAGCGQKNQSDAELDAKTSDSNATDDSTETDSHAHHDHAVHVEGGDVDSSGKIVPAGYTTPAETEFQSVLAVLKPLQVLIGTWRGVTVRSIGGAKAVESPQWNWDFLTNSQQPALVLTSKTSPYCRKARLTYLTDSEVFELKTIDAEGSQRLYEGKWTQPPHESTGRDGQLHRTFELRFIQVSPMAGEEELVLSQQHNNDYLLHVFRRSIDNELKQYDTVATIRQGTPMIIDPEKLGEYSCVTSGGMGTIPLVYGDKTYHVCCEGCKAAFKSNPERWISEFEHRQHNH